MRSVDLLATAVVVEVCIVMRSEGKGMGQINRQCMVHTACSQRPGSISYLD